MFNKSKSQPHPSLNEKKGKRGKVAVAMSGGVDSSVAAALLKLQDYDVMGVFCQFWFPKGEKYLENRCCSVEAFQNAKYVADILDIPLYKLNVGREFKKTVVDQFLKSYSDGQTPNPCVNCNKFIKFGLLFEKVKVIWGVDYLATGHYVRLRRKILNPKSETLNKFKIQNAKTKTVHRLLRGKDKNKDQSYFLYNLNQKILPSLLFPVGKYHKSKVRKLAKKFGLPTHSKKDSQEICFVGSSHYDFLKKYLKLKSGKIVDQSGQILGMHNGLALYTIGQRTGLGLAGGPWYVEEIKVKENQLVVTKTEYGSKIFKDELRVKEINWVSHIPKLPIKCHAQIRYRAKAQKCIVKKTSQGLVVKFKKPQRAIMPGQSVVFYKKEEVLGGGVIS